MRVSKRALILLALDNKKDSNLNHSQIVSEVRGLTIDENENAKWVMDYLSDISRIDKESDMFRYPCNKKWSHTFLI